jgi:hypothetical protein
LGVVLAGGWVFTVIVAAIIWVATGVFWSGAEQRHYTRNATPTTSRNKSVLSNLLSNASNDTVCLSQFLYTSPVGSKDSDAYLQWIWTNELFNSSKMVLYLSSMILFSVLWEFMLK